MKKATNIVVVPQINGISRIKLNEPSTYNALSSETLKSLINIFKSLNNKNETKVIIIEGLGKGFSGGHDLKELRALKKKSKYKKLFNLCSNSNQKLGTNHCICSPIKKTILFIGS